jgi:predicted nucleic acid-binding protein
MSKASVRDTHAVRQAQHLAEVAKTMREFDFDRHTAERWLEVERSYIGIGLPRGDRS